MIVIPPPSNITGGKRYVLESYFGSSTKYQAYIPITKINLTRILKPWNKDET